MLAALFQGTVKSSKSKLKDKTNTNILNSWSSLFLLQVSDSAASVSHNSFCSVLSVDTN